MDPLFNFDTRTKLQLVFYRMYRLCVNNLNKAEDEVCKQFLSNLYNKTVSFDCLNGTVVEDNTQKNMVNFPPQAALVTNFQEIHTDRAVLIADSLIEEEDFSDTDESSDEE